MFKVGDMVTQKEEKCPYYGHKGLLGKIIKVQSMVDTIYVEFRPEDGLWPYFESELEHVQTQPN